MTRRQHEPAALPERPVVPLLRVTPLHDNGRLFALNVATLIASERDVAQTTSGITSGPGNQGTRNTATLVLHAGTAANKIAVPRSLSNGRQQSV